MNGTNAQFVALTCHANAYLRGQSTGHFFPRNSTCKFCDEIKFVECSRSIFGKLKETQIANTPDSWFVYLKQQEVRGLRLVSTPRNEPNIPDRMAAAFVGGGEQWSLEAVLAEERSSYWQSRWEVWDQNAPDRRIWRVAYGKTAESGTTPPSGYALSEARGELRAALHEITEFALQNNCGGFVGCFNKATAALAGENEAVRGYHQDLAPEGCITSEAVQLLDACQHAWVFGGMGSWNDMIFEGDAGETYNRVSERLYRALNKAIPAAANDSFHV